MQKYILGISLLILAWAIYRIFKKLEELDNKATTFEQNLSIIRKKIFSSGNSSTPRDNNINKQSSPPSNKDSNTDETSTKFVECDQCDNRYPENLDKCPECHAINKNKFGL